MRRLLGRRTIGYRLLILPGRSRADLARGGKSATLSYDGLSNKSSGFRKFCLLTLSFSLFLRNESFKNFSALTAARIRQKLNFIQLCLAFTTLTEPMCFLISSGKASVKKRFWLLWKGYLAVSRACTARWIFAGCFQCFPHFESFGFLGRRFFGILGEAVNFPKLKSAILNNTKTGSSVLK